MIVLKLIAERLTIELSIENKIYADIINLEDFKNNMILN